MKYRQWPQARIDEARARLASPLDDDDVHELRLTCKRLRAARQLQRVERPKAAIKAREATPRAIAKTLEGPREARVRHAMLGWALPRLSPELRPVVARLRATLVASLDATAGADRGVLDAEFAREADNWRAEPLRGRQVKAGYRRSRRKARRLAATCAESRDPALCHRWRKWVKYLTYQQALREGVKGKSPKLDPRRLKRLAKRLGRQHDLVNLAAWLQAEATLDASRRDPLMGELHALAEQQLDEGLEQAEKLGWL
ncbi:CHAD domain-containing protein [Modicisalibacter coralii]|uniref:CHAD domain-containing protein n=1 Tax=Modicisalibacter coralii TaxID=2304602 RepID=UPI00100A4269|nr:CHAD domain-containing protein [Halomonas coralii]